MDERDRLYEQQRRHPHPNDVHYETSLMGWDRWLEPDKPRFTVRPGPVWRDHMWTDGGCTCGEPFDGWGSKFMAHRIEAVTEANR